MSVNVSVSLSRQSVNLHRNGILRNVVVFVLKLRSVRKIMNSIQIHGKPIIIYRIKLYLNLLL